MTDKRITTKAELLAAIEHNWSALQVALDNLSPTTMTTIQDEQGWTVKDHLVHLYYWERSALYFLQGKPRHAGLGISEELYLQDDTDAMNAAICQGNHSLTLTAALAQLQAVHQELLAALDPLTDADLQKRYRHYLPDEPGEGDGPPAMNVVYGNSAHHFGEHLAWIEALAGKQG